jgi:hypothetical protein
MKCTSRTLRALATTAVLSLSASAMAVPIGGVEFPQGAVSFADSVVSYSPGLVGGNPSDPHRGAANALGVPNYTGTNSCASQAACTFVSLGDGGSIVLRFLDNVLTGSDSSALDLWIFEVGPDVEDTFVDISTDGTTWLSVGAVGGATAGIDIDAFGHGSGSSFAYVRLTDNGDLDGQTGATVGADIDAVGAITTRRVTLVPEPGALALLGAAIVGMTLVSRRRRA